MLGITAGQVFGGLLTDTLGWRWAFALMSCAFGAVSLMMWRHLHQLKPMATQSHEARGFFQQLMQIADDAWARTFLSITLVEGATVFGALAVTAAHLHQVHGISLTLAGVTTGLFGLGGMAYMATAKITIRRFGEVGLARYGGFNFGIAFLVIAFSPWWQLALPSCFLAGFGFAMFHNTMQAKATQMVPTARGTGVTLFAGFLFLGQSLGVVVLAKLYSHFDSRFILGIDAVAVTLLALFLSYAIAKRNATLADHA
jgi:predicted MFS family arabinose efflux permease